MANKFASRWTCSLAILLSIFMLSCDRSSLSTSNAANIKLDLPKDFNSVLTTATPEVLVHVVINVTAPDLGAPLSIIWDASGGAAPPDSFNLTVPQGSNRLIQVLAVYSNPVTQALDFLYGDANQTLSSPNQTVSVGLNGLGAGPVTVGQVYGRYFNTSTGGPTGNVSINFVPPGKPKMLIQKSLIANGWFSFFMLNGAVLEYALDNGTLLWGTPVDLTSSLLASSTKVFRADVPVSYFLDSGLVAPTWTLMNPLTYVYGWFTDPQMSPTQASSTLSANSVCFNYSDLSSPVPWLSPYSATPPGPTPVLMTGISSGSAQTPLQLLNLTAPLTQYYLSGGISSTSPCLPSTDQVTTFTFNALKLSGHGSDGAGPFAFPFVDTGSTFGSVSAFTITPNMPSDNTYSLKAKLLSGAETAFDQFVAYKIDGDIGGSGNLSCGQLAAGFLGFAEVGSSTISTGTILFQIPLKDLEVSNGVTVAVCGLKNGTMYDQPYVITSDKFSLSNDLIGSVGAPDHIVARPAPGALSYQACVPFQYELHDAVDNLASNTVSQGIEFTMTSSTPGQVQFFADSGCSTTPVTSMNFYSGQVSAEFYVLSSVPVGNQTSIQLTTTNPLIPVSHRSLTQNLYSSPTTQGIFLLMGGMGVHSYDSCFPVSLRAFESDYSTTDSTLTGSNASATISLSGVTGALYYPSATACSADTMDTAGSGTPSFSFNSHGVAMAYVKIPSAGNSPSAYVTATGSLSLTGYSQNYTMTMDRHFPISAAGYPASFAFSATNNYPQPNQCVDYTVTLADGMGTPVTAWSAPSVLPNIQIQDFYSGHFFDHCGGLPLSSTPLFTLSAPATSFSFGYASQTTDVGFQAYAVDGNLRYYNSFDYSYSATADSLAVPTPFYANANAILQVTGTGFDGSETVYVQAAAGPQIPCVVTAPITDTTISCRISANQMTAGTLYQLYVSGEGQLASEATPLQFTPN